MYDFDAVPDRRPWDSVKWSSLRTGDARELLPLWVADMDFPAPPEVVAAIAERASHPVYGYAGARDAFFDAFARWMESRHGTAVDRRHLVFSPGIVPGIALAIKALTGRGDGVVIQSPVYHPFAQMILRNGRRVIDNRLVEGGDGWRMDLADLEAKIDGTTKMILICSPHNPVGRVWSRDELEGVADIARRRGLVLVSDEIHSDMVFPGSRHHCALGLVGGKAPPTIVFHAPSKTFNIAGLQTSVAAIPDDAVRAAFESRLAAAGLGGPNVFGMRAAEAAWTHGAAWLDELIAYLSANRTYLGRRLGPGGLGLRMAPTEGTFLAWLDFRDPRIPSPLEKGSLDAFLKGKAGLWLDEGAKFGPGGEGFARLNFGCPRALLEEAVRRLESALDPIRT